MIGESHFKHSIQVCPFCRQPLLGMMESRPFRRGEVLFLEGEPPRWLYVIEEGKVVLLKEQPDGRKAIIGVRTRGEMVGELAVMDGQPYAETTEGLTNGRLLRIRREDFLASLERYPDLAQHIISSLAERLRQTQELARILTTELTQLLRANPKNLHH